MSQRVAEGLAWVDGELVLPAQATVSLLEPAVQAGLGVFETLAVRDGVPLDLPEHLERMRAAASCLAVELPPDDTLFGAAAAVAGAIEGGCGWLKLSALRAGPCAVWGGRMDAGEEGRSATAVLLPWRRNAHEPVAAHKTLNYANSILGLEEARRRGADEGLWLNVRGHLAEGCTSNLFVVRHRALYTPAVSDGCLPGITRAKVLRIAAELGIAVHEGKVRLEKLQRAHEAFLTSSLRAVRPLVSVDGRPVGRGIVPGPLTKRIAERLLDLRTVSASNATRELR